MDLQRHKRAVGTFSNRMEAERAIEQLKAAGFSMDRVSIIARDADKKDDIAGVDVKDKVDNKADEGAVKGAVTGGALGGITGLLVGLGTLAIPGVGPILLAGAEATALATTLAGGAIGAAAGSLVGSLIGLGIPEERARFYSDRVAGGDYLLMVSGSDSEIESAERILRGSSIGNFGIYDSPVPGARTTERATEEVKTVGTYENRAVPETYTDTSDVVIVDKREQVL